MDDKLKADAFNLISECQAAMNSALSSLPKQTNHDRGTAWKRYEGLRNLHANLVEAIESWISK